jgi:hypothetical protein
LQLFPEALVFNIHALYRNRHLAAGSPGGLCVANAEMIASPVEIKLHQHPVYGQFEKRVKISSAREIICASNSSVIDTLLFSETSGMLNIDS